MVYRSHPSLTMKRFRTEYSASYTVMGSGRPPVLSSSVQVARELQLAQHPLTRPFSHPVRSKS